MLNVTFSLLFKVPSPTIVCPPWLVLLSVRPRLHVSAWLVWLDGVVVGHHISDWEVASSIPGCSASRCNSGQVVHTHVPLFTKQYKLVPASVRGKVHHRSGVGYAGNHSAELTVGGQSAPLQHRSYLWLPLYSGLEVTSVTYAAI